MDNPTRSQPTGDEEDDTEQHDTAIPVNMKRNNTWACRVWDTWAALRNADQTNPDTPQIPVSTNLGKTSDIQLNEFLTRFVCEAHRKDGLPYPPNTLYSIVAAIQRHIRTVRKSNVNIFNDPCFNGMRKSMDSQIEALTKQGIGVGKRQPKIISEDAERKLWDCGVLNMSDSQGLQYAIFFYCSKAFGLRTGVEHRSLMAEQFKVSEDSFGRYFEFQGGPSKKTSSGLNSPMKIRQYDNINNPRSFYKLMVQYLSHIASVGPLYRKPLQRDSNCRCNPIRYGVLPVGEKSLGKYAKRIMQKAKIPGYYTNQSCRETGSGSQVHKSWSVLPDSPTPGPGGPEKHMSGTVSQDVPGQVIKNPRTGPSGTSAPHSVIPRQPNTLCKGLPTLQRSQELGVNLPPLFLCNDALQAAGTSTSQSLAKIQKDRVQETGGAISKSEIHTKTSPATNPSSVVLGCDIESEEDQSESEEDQPESEEDHPESEEDQPESEEDHDPESEEDQPEGEEDHDPESEEDQPESEEDQPESEEDQPESEKDHEEDHPESEEDHPESEEDHPESEKDHPEIHGDHPEFLSFTEDQPLIEQSLANEIPVGQTQKLMLHRMVNHNTTSSSQLTGDKEDGNLNEQHDTAIPVNTKRNNTWACRVWDTWAARWNADQTNPDTPQIPMSTNLGKTSDTQLNDSLTRFVREAHRKDGLPYPPNTLYNILAAIQRHIRTVRKSNVNIFSDPCFNGLQKSMNSQIEALTKQGIGVGKRQPSIFSEDAERKLWDCGIFNTSDSQGLQYAIFFYCSKAFGLRTGVEHRSLMAEQFKVAEDNFGHYVEFQGQPSENPSSGLNSPMKIRQYDDINNPRSFYKLMVQYLSHIASVGPLYRKPLESNSDCSSPPLRYGVLPVGQKRLVKYAKRIMQKAEIPGCYTNQSCTATASASQVQKSILRDPPAPCSPEPANNTGMTVHQDVPDQVVKNSQTGPAGTSVPPSVTPRQPNNSCKGQHTLQRPQEFGGVIVPPLFLFNDTLQDVGTSTPHNVLVKIQKDRVQETVSTISKSEVQIETSPPNSPSSVVLGCDIESEEGHDPESEQDQPESEQDYPERNKNQLESNNNQPKFQSFIEEQPLVEQSPAYEMLVRKTQYLMFQTHAAAAGTGKVSIEVFDKTAEQDTPVFLCTTGETDRCRMKISQYLPMASVVDVEVKTFVDRRGIHVSQIFVEHNHRGQSADCNNLTRIMEGKIFIHTSTLCSHLVVM